MSAHDLAKSLDMTPRDVFGATGAHIKNGRHFTRDEQGLLGLVEWK